VRSAGDTSASATQLPAAHGGVGAQAVDDHAVTVQQQAVGRAMAAAHFAKGGQGVGGGGYRQQARCHDAQQFHRPASTFTRAFGASPNISGAYMASTRLGGRAKSPTLFRRKVYSILTVPLGRYS
jgi:hypothetical protein